MEDVGVLGGGVVAPDGHLLDLLDGTAEILSTRCEGTTQIDTVADGNDGSEEKRTENSAKCGYTG